MSMFVYKCTDLFPYMAPMIMTVETSKTIICRATIQVGHREEVMLQFEAEGSLAVEFHLS